VRFPWEKGSGKAGALSFCVDVPFRIGKQIKKLKGTSNLRGNPHWMTEVRCGATRSRSSLSKGP
jgi:hypothetical protein